MPHCISADEQEGHTELEDSEGTDADLEDSDGTDAELEGSEGTDADLEDSEGDDGSEAGESISNYKSKRAHHLDSSCVLLSDPGVPTAITKTRLESRFCDHVINFKFDLIKCNV